MIFDNNPYDFIFLQRRGFHERKIITLSNHEHGNQSSVEEDLKDLLNVVLQYHGLYHIQEDQDTAKSKPLLWGSLIVI